ncbi:hypothetical protein HN51_016879 [Arachis hypogaea]
MEARWGILGIMLQAAADGIDEEVQRRSPRRWLKNFCRSIGALRKVWRRLWNQNVTELRSQPQEISPTIEWCVGIISRKKKNRVGIWVGYIVLGRANGLSWILSIK